jgi:hypothetical protein
MIILLLVESSDLRLSSNYIVESRTCTECPRWPWEVRRCFGLDEELDVSTGRWADQFVPDGRDATWALCSQLAGSRSLTFRWVESLDHTLTVVKLKLICDRRSVGQCVLVSGPCLEPMTRSLFSVWQLWVSWCSAPSLTRGWARFIRLFYSAG